MAWVYSNFLSKLKTLLNEQNQSVSWTDSDIMAMANIAYCDVLSDTECKKSEYIFRIQENRSEYQLPADCLKPVAFIYNSSKLSRSEPEDLISLEYNSSSGKINSYAFLDYNRIKFSNRPESSGDWMSSNSSYGVIAQQSHSGDTYTENSDYGVITRWQVTGQDYISNSNYGVVAQFKLLDDNVIMIYIQRPDEISATTSSFLVPEIAYKPLLFATLALLYSQYDGPSSSGFVKFNGLYANQLRQIKNKLGSYAPKLPVKIDFGAYRRNVGYRY